MRLQEIQERRAGLVAELEGLPLDSDASRQRFDELRQLVEQAEADVARAAFLLEAERRMAAPAERAGDEFERACRQFSLVKAIASQVPDIAGSIDAGREREVSAELQRRSGRQQQGIVVPLSALTERRTLTTTAPVGGPGANIIATEHRDDLFVDLLREAVVVRTLGATVLTGLRGNLDIPAQKASATAYWVAEDSAITASDIQLRKVSLTPKHAGALTEYSRNMLLQSSPDVEQLVRRDLAAVLAAALDRVAIDGGGANEPSGILSTSGINSVAMGVDGGALTWDAVVNLIAEVELDNALSGNLAFLTNPKVVRSARKTAKVTGTDSVMIMDDPVTLAGYRLATTTLVPSNLTKGAGVNLSALIFGNFADLLIGVWDEASILINPFESTAYAKGNVMVRAMTTCDISVRHAESFGAITDLTTT